MFAEKFSLSWYFDAFDQLRNHLIRRYAFHLPLGGEDDAMPEYGCDDVQNIIGRDEVAAANAGAALPSDRPAPAAGPPAAAPPTPTDAYFAELLEYR
jgi:hypothetical protein